MTYFLNNPMYPKELLLEAISKRYIAVNDKAGFTCIASGCDGCPINDIKDAFCRYASRHTEWRQQIAATIKAEHPEILI